MRIKIYTDATKTVVDSIILASAEFAEAHCPGRWDLDDVQDTVKPAAWEWFIDIGPFMDRFGAQKIAILSSVDAVVQAIINDMQPRKWIDLKRPDVAQALDLILSKGFPIDKAAILETPVSAEENAALRKVYFT